MIVSFSASGRTIDLVSINQYIYNAPWYRGACYSVDYAEAKRNVLSRVLNVITDGAVRQFRGSEFIFVPQYQIQLRRQGISLFRQDKASQGQENTRQGKVKLIAIKTEARQFL